MIHWRAWSTAAIMPDTVDKDTAEDFRLAIYRSLDQFMQFRYKEPTAFGDAVEMEIDDPAEIPSEYLFSSDPLFFKLMFV